MVRNPIAAPHVLALALLTACLLVEYVVLGGWAAVWSGDNAEIFLPQFLSPRFDQTWFPAWDRFSAAGSDRTTEGSTTYILTLLYRVLPVWLATQLLVAASVVAAVLGSYVLCRRTLGLSPWAGVFGAFCYAVGTNYAFLLNSVICWMPALIALLGWALDAPKALRRWLAVAAAVVFVAKTAYLSRLFPFPPVTIVVWFLLVDRRHRALGWAAAGAVAAGLVGLRLGDIRALSLMAELSHVKLARWQYTVAMVIEQNLDPVTFLRDGMRASVGALIVLLGLRGGWRDARFRGLLAVILLGLLLPVGATALQLAVLDRVPSLYGYNLNRFVLLTATALPFAGAMGFESLLGLAAALPRQLWRGAVLAALAGPALVLLQYKKTALTDWLSQGNYVHNLGSPVFAELAERIAADGQPMRAETVQIYPTYLHAYGIETAGGYQPVYFRRYYEFWAKMVEPWAKTLPPEHEYWGVPTQQAAKAGGPAFRGDRLALTNDDHRTDWELDRLYHMNLLSLANVGWLAARDRLHAAGLEMVREAPAPWSGLTLRQRIETNLKANFRGREHLYIYRNHNVLPRFFGVSGVRLLADGEHTLDAMAAASPEELRRTAFLADADAQGEVRDGQEFAPLSARVAHYGADRIELEVDAAGGDGFLVVTNAFSPYWQVTIDGSPARLLAADHAFWGVRIPAGRHRVAFRYQPPFAFP